MRKIGTIPQWSVSVSSSCSINCVPGVVWVFSVFIFVIFEYLGRSLYELWTLVLVWYLAYFLC
jgi:hypothetical protein